jgi:hypothetical protein
LPPSRDSFDFAQDRLFATAHDEKGEGGAADPELPSEFDQISLFIEDCPDITRCIDAWIPSNGAVLGPISLVSPAQAPER